MAAKQLQATITRALERDEYKAVASLDLSAAFDVINMELLMKRLKIAGFPQDIMDMLTAWFNDSWAYVEEGESCSGCFRDRIGTFQGSCLGPVLFNLFISPLLRTGSDPAYADDSYYVTTGATKDVALAEMQERIRIAEKWMSGSGLKVNLKKTEMVIFHRMDTSKGSITVGGNVISLTSKINVLGIIFDNQLQWDMQIDKTINDTRRAVQALRTV